MIGIKQRNRPHRWSPGSAVLLNWIGSRDFAKVDRGLEQTVNPISEKARFRSKRRLAGGAFDDHRAHVAVRKPWLTLADGGAFWFQDFNTILPVSLGILPEG